MREIGKHQKSQLVAGHGREPDFEADLITRIAGHRALLETAQRTDAADAELLAADQQVAGLLTGKADMKQIRLREQAVIGQIVSQCAPAAFRLEPIIVILIVVIADLLYQRNAAEETRSGRLAAK